MRDTTDPYELDRPGLFAINDGTKERHIANVRRIAGTGRKPGSVLISIGGALLGEPDPDRPVPYWLTPAAEALLEAEAG